MSKQYPQPTYVRLKEHLGQHNGHKIVVACYGKFKDPVNIAVECETCNCVIIDSDKYAESDEDDCLTGKEREA